MEKWNEEKGCFEPYEVPKHWTPRVCSSDKREFINCASCGKVIRYDKGKPSKFIINGIGFGYRVCQECYEKEVKKELMMRYGE